MKLKKSNTGLLIFFLIMTVSSHAQDWEMVWNDEFDYTGLPDDTKWSFETDGNSTNWGNNEAQNYTPPENDNAWVDGENLVIEARKEAYYWAGDGETSDYTSARLRTAGKGDWLYGKVEVRALLPTGVGVWPAIWMLPTDWDYGGWPASGELDIMENVGYDPTTLHCNIHTESYNHGIGTNKGNSVTISDPNTNWHIYSMEWNEENVSFFCDGDLVFSFDNEHNTYAEWPFDKRFHLLLNIAVGGSWGGAQGIDDTIFPQQMKVDYVRVYQIEPEKKGPYTTAISIPGTLEMEEYDKGGAGLAYSDVSPSNEGEMFRSDGVDIEECSAGGFNIAYTRDGEWLEYTVSVSETGLYDIDFLIASFGSTGAFHLEEQGNAISDTILVSETGTKNWQDWQIATAKNVALTAGEQSIRFVIDTGNFNIDKCIFRKQGSTPIDTIVQTITLEIGWNMVSLYVDPFIPSVSEIFPNVTSIKNDGACFNNQWPQYLNSITDLESGAGYLVYSPMIDTITVSGTEADSFSPPTTAGWHLIGYPFSQPAPIETVFTGLTDNILRIKNIDGYWLGSGENNSIEYLEPSSAYFILIEL